MILYIIGNIAVGLQNQEDDLVNKRTAIVAKDTSKSNGFDLLGFLNSEESRHPEVLAGLHPPVQSP